MRYLISSLAVVTLSAAGPGLAAADHCALLPQGLPPSPVKRAIEPTDLLTLRDIGPDYLELPRQKVFTVSPDKTRIAFQIRRASVGGNEYCFGMFVLTLANPTKVVQVDNGGEYLMARSSAWGFADTPPPGMPLAIAPAWSADGQWIAYLRRDQGSTQVWRARADGGGAEQITHLPFDVEDFAWSDDNAAVIVRGRPALKQVDHDVTNEGKTGYHFDDRFIVSVSSRPLPREPMETEYVSVAVGSGETKLATAYERAQIDPTLPSRDLTTANWSVSGTHGETASIVSLDAGNLSSPLTLRVRNRAGKNSVCKDEACSGVSDAWFEEGTGALIFMRRIRGHNEQEVFRLIAGREKPVRLFRTENFFSSCTLVHDQLLCAEEEPTSPRRIVALNLKTRAVQPVFDPNPEFAALRLGSAQLLRWTNSYGVESFGTLVLPPDHKIGEKHPLIIVGYIARGFMRGGTGDEYPILPLAEKGYAVLSYQTPPDVAYAKGATKAEDVGRLNRVQWMDYRNTSASIDAGIAAAIKLGVVDETKIGLTGLSYGASVAQFKLVNTRRFGAAVLSTCCEEESNATMLAGPGFAKAVHAMGYPGLTEDGEKFWAPISFRANAKGMSTPLLLQVADREFLGTTEAVMALREAGQPVDMYVYPNESHLKWQPQHRLSVYRRNIQWFDFWLRGIEDADPVNPQQYEYWRSLRLGTSNTASGAPGQ